MKKFVPLCLVLVACGQSPQKSESKWAHSPAEKSWGTISALLNYVELGFKTNFSSLRVCLQGSESFQGSALLLESKLAYAAWLNGSGQGSQSAWNRFSFVTQEICDPKDTSYSSVVLIESSKRASAGRDPSEAFVPVEVNCQKSAQSVRCSSGSTTFGWGGPSAISYSYITPSKWESVSNVGPASVRLSPFVKWRSLAVDLSEQKNLSDSNRASLLQLYGDLLTQADSVSYSELVDFMNKLSDVKLLAVSDGSFQKLMQDFQGGAVASLNQQYVPNATALHILLHEVGHQFGMDHADNPARDSETGVVLQSQQVGNQWVTSEAAMAYGKPFLYLTADDGAGVLDLSQKTRQIVSSRRGL